VDQMQRPDARAQNNRPRVVLQRQLSDLRNPRCSMAVSVTPHGARQTTITKGHKMKHYTQEELAEVLRLHQLWMVDEEDGVKAEQAA